MATREHIMFMGGPLDGQVREGSFPDRLYFDMNLNPIEAPLTMDSVQNTRLHFHAYRRSLPTYEFEYEGDF